MLNILTTSNPKEQAALEINKILSEYKAENQDILLLLAGGSSFAIYDLIDPSLIDSHVTFGTTDDRYTDDIFNNNFATLQSTRLYNDTLGNGTWAIGTEPYGDESHEEFRARYEFGIQKWLNEFPKGKIVAVFGIGLDGHIAGIIPGVLPSAEFHKEYDSEHLVGKINAQGKNEFPLRISIAFPLMRKVDRAIIFAAGENKKDILKKVVDKKSDVVLDVMPSRIIHEMPNVILVTDQDL